MQRKKIVVLTGAGISAESGIRTFRDADGLWEGHDVMEVASPQGWARNRELVLDFYNQRRRQLHEVLPNEGHKALVRLEEKYDVTIITQNVDNLHEKAGSSHVIHLHGELIKVRSTGQADLVYEWPGDLNAGDLCEKGHQLRPHIVWFGEMVPMMDEAIVHAREADIFMVIGTSLLVYPAAGLIHYAPDEALKFLIDPSAPAVSGVKNLRMLSARATEGVPLVVKELL
jgi:NAD-dependent deacetylase